MSDAPESSLLSEHLRRSRKARQVLADLPLPTPVVSLPYPAFPNGLTIKLESLSRIGSFKYRGAVTAISQLGSRGAGGVCTFSSGNHAQAVAWAAQLSGIPASVLMPTQTSEIKRTATEELGASVTLTDRPDYESEAYDWAIDLGVPLIHPFDDIDVIAGQGTIGLELLEQVSELERVYVPVSGGGLIAGIAGVIKAINPTTEIIGVEPILAADATETFESGHIVQWPAVDTQRTIAEGLRSPTVGTHNWDVISKCVDRFVNVSETEMKLGIKGLLLSAGIVAEPSGAAAIAAAQKDRPLDGYGSIAVLSGRNCDAATLHGYVAACQPA